MEIDLRNSSAIAALVAVRRQEALDRAVRIVRTGALLSSVAAFALAVATRWLVEWSPLWAVGLAVFSIMLGSYAMRVARLLDRLREVYEEKK